MLKDGRLKSSWQYLGEEMCATEMEALQQARARLQSRPKALRSTMSCKLHMNLQSKMRRIEATVHGGFGVRRLSEIEAKLEPGFEGKKKIQL